MLVNFNLEPMQTEIHFVNSFESAFSFFKAIHSSASDILLLVDQTSCDLFSDVVINSLQKLGTTVFIFVVPVGELAKTRPVKEEVENFLIKNNLGKRCAILALGGGSVLDLAGFIASSYLRGVSLFSIPTTLLGMVDACLGGKTAVNAYGMKNAIGSFYPAEHILICLDSLDSLPYAQMQSALAEIIKYALIASPEIFTLLQKNKDLWIKKDLCFLEKLIYLSLEIKKTIVEQDLKERGLRRSLNFGHTIGHAVESCSLYSYSHGESIAIGLFIESYLSMTSGSLSQKNLERIVQLLTDYGFPLREHEQNKFCFDQLHPFLILDKKNMNKTPRFVTLSSIGKVDPCNGNYCRPISEEKIKEALLWYEQRDLPC